MSEVARSSTRPPVPRGTPRRSGRSASGAGDCPSASRVGRRVGSSSRCPHRKARTIRAMSAPALAALRVVPDGRNLVGTQAPAPEDPHLIELILRSPSANSRFWVGRAPPTRVGAPPRQTPDWGSWRPMAAYSAGGDSAAGLGRRHAQRAAVPFGVPSLGPASFPGGCRREVLGGRAGVASSHPAVARRLRGPGVDRAAAVRLPGQLNRSAGRGAAVRAAGGCPAPAGHRRSAVRHRLCGAEPRAG
jgi:hypothetical protein